ncbi:MAG: hypothetical protein RL077_4140 [Verrucomicrobiota bacterium]|jgi:peptidoglycan-associated lipoprotein
MKLASKKFYLAFASAILVVTGCSKKPSRPDPASTLLGPQGGGANIAAAAPTNVDFNPNAPQLQARSDFDPNGENRVALQGQTVYFDFDQSSIKASEREKLKSAKEYLDKNPTHRLVLEGRCDWRGTSEYNLGLGDRRASSTKKYLQSIGVSADKLETRSKGSLEASKNADDGTMGKDRRVELIVIDPSASAARPL